jgi:hypothetical protein
LSPDKDGGVLSFRLAVTGHSHAITRTGTGTIMSEAQLGLLTATPIIIAFACTLRAMGVLSTVATVSATTLSVAIALLLFTTQ